jgi:uncharacterized protein
MSTSEHHHHIHYIEFRAPDLDATKAFYGSVFGWQFQDWGPDYISFERAGVAGGFQRGVPVRGAGALVVLFSIDLEATEAAVRAAGAPILKPIFSFPGGRRFHFADPGGNELAVWGE